MVRRPIGAATIVACVLLASPGSSWAEDGETLVRDNCMMCHRDDDPRYPTHHAGWVFGKHYDQAGWQDNIVRMEAIAIRDEYISEPWTDEEKSAMADYLTEQTKLDLTDEQRIGMLHFSVVHFPIALIFVLGLLELLSLLAGWPIRRDFRHLVGWLGFLACAVTVALGYVLIWNLSALSHDMTDHRNAGLASLIGMGLAMIVREWACGGRAWAGWLYRALLLFAIVATGAAGHLGGKMVHGEYLPDWLIGATTGDSTSDS